MDSTPIQYWDSCLFISLLTGKDEKRLPILRELIRELEERKTIRVVISTFVIAEVRPDSLNSSLPKQQFQMAVELLRSDKLEQRPLTESIALKAQDIGKNNPKQLPGDCVHIATALEARAEMLFTFDGASDASGKRRRPREMIAHNGKIGNPSLKICEPYLYSGPLFEVSESLEEEDSEDSPELITNPEPKAEKVELPQEKQSLPPSETSEKSA